jgi:hypothetical protein
MEFGRVLVLVCIGLASIIEFSFCCRCFLGSPDHNADTPLIFSLCSDLVWYS